MAVYPAESAEVEVVLGAGDGDVGQTCLGGVDLGGSWVAVDVGAVGVLGFGEVVGDAEGPIRQFRISALRSWGDSHGKILLNAEPTFAWQSKGRGFESSQLHSCGDVRPLRILPGQGRCRGIVVDLLLIDYSRCVH